MPLRKIPLKPLTATFNKDKFNYDYVDAMVTKQDRYRKWLLDAKRGPIRINWEGHPKFNKDLRALVKLGFLELKREYLKLNRKISHLHITELGKKHIGVDDDGL
jgi:hypothetical protein